MKEPKEFAQDHDEWKNRPAIDYLEARDLFPHGGNKVTRRTKQFTLTKETCDAWEDFLHTHSGSKPQRGRGISSTMTEVAQKLLMAVIAGFNIADVTENLQRIIPNEYAIERMKENLETFLETLDK